MKITYSTHGRNKWLRIGNRLFGYIPQGIKTPSNRNRKHGQYAYTLKTGKLAFQNLKTEVIGYPVYAGMVIGAGLLIKVSMILVAALIERGM